MRAGGRVRACVCVRASRSNSLGGEPCVRAVTAIVAATVVYELQTLKVFRLASDDDLKTADIERLIRLVSGLPYSVTRSVRNPLRAFVRCASALPLSPNAKPSRPCRDCTLYASASLRGGGRGPCHGQVCIQLVPEVLVDSYCIGLETLGGFGVLQKRYWSSMSGLTILVKFCMCLYVTSFVLCTCLVEADVGG